MAIDLTRRLNLIDHLSQWRSVDDLCSRLSFQPSFKFALHWILERLVEIDCVEARTDGNFRSYHLRHTLRKPALENLRAAGLQIDPANAATLNLLDYAASLYPVVASDERGLLPWVERYLVTEPNAFFLRCGQRKLARQYPNLSLEWAALNLDLPWSTQGINPGEFDLVYAVNVMHISRNLLFSLNEARSALASDGWLVIGECLRPYFNQPIYPELMFQILESFTNVQTDPEVRPNPGFLTAEQWRCAFTRAGFQRVEVAPDIDRIREIYRHFFTGAICGQNVVSNK
jgi:SAM-dependent methyltransferase